MELVSMLPLMFSGPSLHVQPLIITTLWPVLNYSAW